MLIRGVGCCCNIHQPPRWNLSGGHRSPPLTPQVLTDIYGEEDWSATIRRGEDENEGDGKKKKSVKEKGFVREASVG